jgi:hypothetical protein
MRFSVNASVPHQRMADHVKKRGTKESNVSKCIRSYIYDSYLEIVVIKHAEKTAMKQKENTESLGANI